MYEPAIKWSGSKRSQAEKLLTFFPKYINIYYEPFCGGCSVLNRLLNSSITVEKYICSDINADLINLWNYIKRDYTDVVNHYSDLWYELNKDNNLDRKREFFNTIRKRYNEYRNPLDFMFIMRTTTNGMPRYNSNGEFNNSFHITRNGIQPQKLDKILYAWNKILNEHNVEFIYCSYKDIIPIDDKCFMYLDPPYANTKGMYYGNIDYNEFWNYLKNLNCNYMFSFDGKSGKIDNTFEVPVDVYNRHFYIKSGNSSFKRTVGKDKNAMVYESLYIK